MKVFGIGLGRTGTTSLAEALQILGFRAKHCPGFYLDQAGKLCVSEEEIREHDAATDEPVALIYQDLDRQYPGSRFILTVREKSSWLRSIENNSTAMRDWWARKPAVAVLHKAIYGTAAFDRTRYAETYDRHVAGVLAYFRGRDEDLLLLDVCAGEGWDKLCPFVGKPVPDVPFPRLNVFGESDWMTVLRRRGGRGDVSSSADRQAESG